MKNIDYHTHDLRTDQEFINNAILLSNSHAPHATLNEIDGKIEEELLQTE